MTRAEAEIHMWHTLADQLGVDLHEEHSVDIPDLRAVWAASFTNSAQSRWWRIRVGMVASFVRDCRDCQEEIFGQLTQEEQDELELLFREIETSLAVSQDG